MRIQTSSNKALVCFEARPQAQTRLLCFSFAGGGSGSFRLWSRSLPESVEVWAVQLPGRESRFRDAFHENLQAQVDEIIVAVNEMAADKPLLLFGHSFGAYMAYCCAQELRRLGQAALLKALLVSARRAPHLPFEVRKSGLNDDQLVDQIGAMGGAGSDLLADPTMRAIALPKLRHDFFLNETALPAQWSLQQAGPLPIPMCLYFGTRDQQVSPALLHPWRDYCLRSDRFSQRAIDGGHFFLSECEAAFLPMLREDIMQIVSTSSTAVPTSSDTIQTL